MNLKSMPKVHLIVTVFLTDLSLMPIDLYGARISPSQNKVNQFLTTLHMLSRLSVSSSEFHVLYSEGYREMTNLVSPQISLFFPNSELKSTRFEIFDDWRECAKKCCHSLEDP